MPDPYGSALLADRIVVRVPAGLLDTAGDVPAVRFELGSREPAHPMRLVDGDWTATRARPPVDRVEYAIRLAGRAGPDPANPVLAPASGGTRSVLTAAGYRPPPWVSDPPPDVTRREVRVGCAATVELLAGRDVPDDVPLPLLVVLDGPEYVEHARLPRLLARPGVPAHRVCLVPGTGRATRFAADPRWAAELGERILPGIAARVHVAGRPVLLGASLGGLAAVHAVATGAVDAAGVLAQSGSFLRPDLDAHETAFAGFAAVSWFVDHCLDDPVWAAGRHWSFTCGAGEENRANNRRFAQRLDATGAPVAYREVRDAHTWTCWRDGLDPALPELLGSCWR